MLDTNRPIIESNVLGDSYQIGIWGLGVARSQVGVVRLLSGKVDDGDSDEYVSSPQANANEQLCRIRHVSAEQPSP